MTYIVPKNVKENVAAILTEQQNTATVQLSKDLHNIELRLERAKRTKARKAVRAEMRATRALLRKWTTHPIKTTCVWHTKSVVQNVWKSGLHKRWNH